MEGADIFPIIAGFAVIVVMAVIMLPGVLGNFSESEDIESDLERKNKYLEERLRSIHAFYEKTFNEPLYFIKISLNDGSVVETSNYMPDVRYFSSSKKVAEDTLMVALRDKTSLLLKDGSTEIPVHSIKKAEVVRSRKVKVSKK